MVARVSRPGSVRNKPARSLGLPVQRVQGKLQGFGDRDRDARGERQTDLGAPGWSAAGAPGWLVSRRSFGSGIGSPLPPHAFWQLGLASLCALSIPPFRASVYSGDIRITAVPASIATTVICVR
ncbi:MAG: hypothetical protein ACRDSR_13340 [Pseudonocardiaceae bacterium]